MTQQQGGATASPIILTIDTTSSGSNIALWGGLKLLYSEVDPDGTGEHAARLAPMVERALEWLRSQGLGLSAVALSAGPGSYTGLRIASSLAKGLCQGFSIPLIGLSTLEIMAHAYLDALTECGGKLPSEAIVCPMMDARRMEVYTATFAPDLSRLTPDMARVLSAEDVFAPNLENKTYHFVGNGAPKTEGLWSATYHIEKALPPLATAMGRLALQAYETKAFVDLAYWTPNYLKDYVAVVAKNKVLNR